MKGASGPRVIRTAETQPGVTDRGPYNPQPAALILLPRAQVNLSSITTLSILFQAEAGN